MMTEDPAFAAARERFEEKFSQFLAALAELQNRGDVAAAEQGAARLLALLAIETAALE